MTREGQEDLFGRERRRTQRTSQSHGVELFRCGDRRKVLTVHRDAEGAEFEGWGCCRACGGTPIATPNCRGNGGLLTSHENGTSVRKKKKRRWKRWQVRETIEADEDTEGRVKKKQTEVLEEPETSKVWERERRLLKLMGVEKPWGSLKTTTVGGYRSAGSERQKTFNGKTPAIRNQNLNEISGAARLASGTQPAVTKSRIKPGNNQ